MRRVVVTGVGVVSPIGARRQAFFDGLREARSGIRTIASFDASTFPTRIAGEVADPVEIPPWVEEPERAVIARDPKSRFAVAAAEEALADAFGRGKVGAAYEAERIGVLLGAGLEICHLGDLAPHVRDGSLDGASLLGAVSAAAPGACVQTPADLPAQAVAQRAGAEGPVAVNVSACTAGAQAIGEAFFAIRDGIADAVLTGGYDSMVNPLGVGGFCMLDALSRENERPGHASRPFDRDRGGFVLGEGAAVLVLEEREAARRRGATLHAEVLGYASSLDAFRVSDPDPTLEGAVAAMSLALERAGQRPGEVDYVSAHGTGTRKNDPAESQAIRRVLGSATDRVPVSSTKSQIGHLIAAAGAVELVACLFAISESLVPATLNLDAVDPECALDHVPHRPRPHRVRVALSNSFGFGGQNACLVVGHAGSGR